MLNSTLPRLIAARQYVCQPLRADHAFAAESLRVVPVESAREQNFQKQPVPVEPARSNDKAAISEGTVAPDVPAGKKHDARIVKVVGTRRTKRHADTAQTESGGGTDRRPNAPPATHGANPGLLQNIAAIQG
jgi:hypothetical protein